MVLLDAPATINMDHLTGHIVAVMACQKGCGTLHVSGIRHAFDHKFVVHDIFIGLTGPLFEADLDEVFVELFPKRCDDGMPPFGGP